MGIDVRLLKPFLAVADKLSFTKAAEKLDVSQPRLSLLIKKLEEQLGFTLLVRKPHNVRLTDEGVKFLEEARRANEALQKLDEAVWRLRGGARSKIRLGSTSFSRDVPNRVALIDEFSVRHPALRLEIEDGHTPRLIEHLRQDKLDLTLANAPFDDRGLESVLLAKSTPLLAVPQESPLARLSEIDAKAIRGAQIAIFPHYIGAPYVQTWYQPLQEAGAILIESNEPHYGTQLRFAARRRLSTIVHRWEGQLREPNDGFPDLTLRSIVGFELAIRLYLVRKPGSHSGPVEWLWKLAEQFSRDGGEAIRLSEARAGAGMVPARSNG